MLSKHVPAFLGGLMMISAQPVRKWSNVYNRVNVTLTTHDADGVTQLDIKTAKAMNGWAE